MTAIEQVSDPWTIADPNKSHVCAKHCSFRLVYRNKEVPLCSKLDKNCGNHWSKQWAA